jgi:hypothetical protein
MVAHTVSPTVVSSLRLLRTGCCGFTRVTPRLVLTLLMVLPHPPAGPTRSVRTLTVPLCRLATARLLLPLALGMRLVLWSTARATALLSMLGFDLWMFSSDAIESYDFVISRPFSGISGSIIEGLCSIHTHDIKMSPVLPPPESQNII